MRVIKLLVFTAALVISLAGFSFGQEVGGSIEGTVTDAQGGRIANVTVTVTGVTQGFNRTSQTDAEGFYRIQQVPPGSYKVGFSGASGFGETSKDNVQVNLGRPSTVDIQLGAAQVTGDVTVSGSDTAGIETTESKIQTNISQRTAELLPKGVNFTSLLNTAAAVRSEGLAGGFQIDGASGSENTFIIDGQEVSNFRTGVLNTNNNIPFQFVQEVQIKSSGFEAEFGGATGGVINVVTRGGSNEFHGDVGIEFRPSELQGNPRRFLRLTSVAASAGVTALTTPEYIQPRKDGGTDIFPFATLSGPIVKNKAWFFGSYAPQLLRTNRTIEYVTNDPRTRTITRGERYTSAQRNEYAFGRIDLQPWDNLRMTGSYLWNPIDLRGTLPTFDTLFGAVPSITFPGIGPISGPQLQDNIGGRQSSNNTTGSIVWTPTNKLVLTARGGYSFLNEKIGNYGIPSVVGQTRYVNQATGSPTPADFGIASGTQNFAGFTNTFLDASRRRTFDADASYLVSGFGGRHQFKGGFQFNGINNVIRSTLVDTVVIRFGLNQSIESVSGHEFPRSPTSIGAGWLQRFGAQGSAGSDNIALYVQDNWQPISNLTLNLGIRTERENSPSFNELGDGVKFGFMDKIAPRLGFAWDIFKDGNTKLFGSYGQFYDRFKYELPRGSLGVNFFRNDYFELFPGQTAANFTRQTIIGSNPDPIGGTCPIPNSGGFSRCQLDFRIPSNLPGQPDFGEIDPDIKAFRQSEYTIGLERNLFTDLVFRGRYTHKQVDVAVEDVGVPVPGGEAYIIGNPGRGLVQKLNTDNNFVNLEAVRDYDALELGLDKRFSRNYYFNASYTFSRLFGNYAGLASSDENGRTSPNVNRNFDLPFIGFSALGAPDNGRLATDRPHVGKLSGAYAHEWSKTNSTELSGFTTLQSGTPLSTRFTFAGVGGQFLNGRGDLGRTEAFSQTDLGFRHRYRFGNDGRFTLVGNVDVLNVFNEANVFGVFDTISTRGITLAPITGTVGPAGIIQGGTGDLGLTTDALQRARLFQTRPLSTDINNFLRVGTPTVCTPTGATAIVPSCSFIDPRFGQANSFQGPRSVRFGFKLQF
ncbi:MAG: TonB-dependent receptor domain-containing protein [Pyrinomonadaceae bacterium]